MANDRVFAMSFAGVYPHYVNKAEKKGRTKQEVDEIICWLTGYDEAGLEKHNHPADGYQLGRRGYEQ